MDLFAIVKRSWEIVRTRRWLWGLGVLAAFTESGGMDLLNQSDFNKGDFQKFINPSVTPTPGASPTPVPSDSLTAKVLGDSIDTQKLDSLVSSVGGWLSSHAGLLIGAAIVLVVLSLIFLYLSYVARAGIIKSVRALEEHDKDLGFKAAFKAGTPYAAKLFGLQLLSGLVIFAVTLILLLIFGAPFIVVNNESIAAIALMGIWVLIGIILAIISIYFIGMAYRYGEQQVVVNESGVMSGFTTGLNLVQTHFKQSVYASFVMFLVSLAFGMIVAAVLVPVMLLIIGIGVGAYAGGGVALAVLYGIVVGIIFLVVTFTLSGFHASYILTFWSLVFKKLQHTHKAVEHKTA